MNPPSSALRFGLLAAIVVLVVAASTLLGPTQVSWPEIRDVSLSAFFQTETPSNVYWHLRVPRALLAAVAGAGLAVGGVIFQILFRNPLATPYTLGVASGASLAAAIGFLSGWTGYVAVGLPRLTLLAFLGAMAAMLIVYGMSRVRASRDMTRLLLAGVCVAYMCSAGILLITYLADRAVTNDIVTWMMGSLSTIRPRAGLEVAVVLVPVLLIAICWHRALDLLNFGDDLAAARGVDVPRVIWGSYALIGLLIAVIVANCGPIGFVGLMVPHLCRAMVGVRTLPLLIASALFGAGFLAASDAIARTVLMVELPVGVVTNFVGAIFFFYLLATRDVAHSAVRN